MSPGTVPDIDQFDFVYSPEQPFTTEQRLELLELQAAEMREQISALVEQLTWLTAALAD